MVELILIIQNGLCYQFPCRPFRFIVTLFVPTLKKSIFFRVWPYKLFVFGPMHILYCCSKRTNNSVAQHQKPIYWIYRLSTFSISHTDTEHTHTMEIHFIVISFSAAHRQRTCSFAEWPLFGKYKLNGFRVGYREPSINQISVWCFSFPLSGSANDFTLLWNFVWKLFTREKKMSRLDQWERFANFDSVIHSGNNNEKQNKETIVRLWLLGTIEITNTYAGLVAVNVNTKQFDVNFEILNKTFFKIKIDDGI